ncbi:MAG: hypothetical protein NT062_06330 [Proteobacteria bacterium]|nr:hypothetical protein [Pseudomonadota bacterium]
MRAIWAILFFGLVGCASAGTSAKSGDRLDANETVDGPAPLLVDAPTHPGPHPDGTPVAVDARPLDAFVPQDAPPSSGFCDNNGQCTVAGECCFSLGGSGLCVPGALQLGVCLPN